MRILVTNDDGIFAPGINALIKELEKEHQVIAAAPNDQRSASGHSITLSRPLLVKEVKLEGINSKAYSIDGTPADCVRIALDKLVDGKVDLVVSGINQGYNLGTDVLYSGTVSAAIEASMYKVPAIALSQGIKNDFCPFEQSAKYSVSIVNSAFEKGLEANTVLSVNFPPLEEDKIIGIKVCKIGARNYTNNYIAIQEQEDGTLYELRDKLLDLRNEDTDTQFIEEGYITITPLQYDLTNFNLMHQVSKWFSY